MAPTPVRAHLRRAVYVVLLVLLAGISVAWARASLAPVTLVEASYGRVERSVEAEAVLIRREEVVAAPFTGRTSYGVGEGEEVRAGAPVVELSNPRARAALEAELDQRRSRLAAFEAGPGAGLADLPAAERAGEDALQRRLAELGEAARRADGPGMAQAWRALDAASRQLAETRAALAQLTEERKGLLNEVELAQQALARAVTRLAAPVPGIVSYTVDGLEEVLVPEVLKGLRGTTLADLKARPARLSKGQVRGGEPLFKVIDPSQVYFAMLVAGAEAEALRPRSPARLRIATPGEREWDGLVERIGELEADGRRLVILSVPAAAAEVALLRRVRATLVLKEAAGATVPVQVLLRREEGWGLYLLRGNQARWHPVVVRISDGRTAALEGINPGALVVLRPQFVKEGQKIR